MNDDVDAFRMPSQHCRWRITVTYGLGGAGGSDAGLILVGVSRGNNEGTGGRGALDSPRAHTSRGTCDLDGGICHQRRGLLHPKRRIPPSPALRPR
jgi:hypothetical protein